MSDTNNQPGMPGGMPGSMPGITPPVEPSVPPMTPPAAPGEPGMPTPLSGDGMPTPPAAPQPQADRPLAETPTDPGMGGGMPGGVPPMGPVTP